MTGATGPREQLGSFELHAGFTYVNPVVGLTGGIATGKSTVSSHIAAHGVPVIDADVLARQVVLPGTRALSQIVAEFGGDILLPNGTLDRQKLGDIVFHDPAKRKKLNGIVHPAVRWAMAWGVFKCWLLGKKLCVLDVPLLIESGIYRWVGKVVVVYCTRETQLHRLMRRDGSTEDKAIARLDAQMPIAQKRDYADYEVDNTGPLDEIGLKVTALVKTLGEAAGKWWWLTWIVPPWGLAAAVWTLASRRRTQRKNVLH